jgi:predicted metallo-beta-lactamase superfamily hydrolase
MNIIPLAADSLGVRSMATRVDTPDVTLLIDPGVRLGPYRYDLPPHEVEVDRKRALWRGIRDAAKKADILTVSHYHFDHHEPDAPSIYKGKQVFLKDGKFHINRSQRERASAFVRALKKYPREVQVADGNALDVGGTEIVFSPAVPHGYSDELGYVVMVRVSHGGETFVHTSDVQGPPLKEQLSFLLDSDPTVLYVDGPMTHMPENYPEEMTKRSIANLTRILRATGIRTLILDHHALRDRDWRQRMAPVLEAGEAHDVRVVTAAEFLGKAVDQLEANRDRLYGLEGKKEDRDDATKVRSPFS